jgi:2-phospho-L-lactate guanylyltransferase (CobY/MobA/RfbA family)
MWVMYTTIHNTRQSAADLTLPKPKTNSIQNAFSHRGAEVWNCLSASLKASTTVLMYRNGQLNVDYHKQKSTLLISLVEGSLFKSPLLSEIKYC